MAIPSERKLQVTREYATKPGDTGSPEVQVALLSENILNLTEHQSLPTCAFGLIGKSGKSRPFLREARLQRVP